MLAVQPVGKASLPGVNMWKAPVKIEGRFRKRYGAFQSLRQIRRVYNLRAGCHGAEHCVATQTGRPDQDHIQATTQKLLLWNVFACFLKRPFQAAKQPASEVLGVDMIADAQQPKRTLLGEHIRYGSLLLHATNGSGIKQAAFPPLYVSS